MKNSTTKIEILDEESPEPNFVLSLFEEDENEDVEFVVDLPDAPSIERHASLSSLIGLAILVLNDNGTLEATVNEIMGEGPINEVDCHNRIGLLLSGDANELPI